MKKELTQQRLFEVAHYIPEKGIFIRLFGCKGSRAGDIMGSYTKAGYIEITIDYERYYAHRLAFLYMIGKFPSGCVDHLDHNGCNN
jgi:hypothetical protein